MDMPLLTAVFAVFSSWVFSVPALAIQEEKINIPLSEDAFLRQKDKVKATDSLVDRLYPLGFHKTYVKGSPRGVLQYDSPNPSVAAGERRKILAEIRALWGGGVTLNGAPLAHTASAAPTAKPAGDSLQKLESIGEGLERAAGPDRPRQVYDGGAKAKPSPVRAEP